MEDSKQKEKTAKANKPVNFKAKYITLGVMVAVLIAVVVVFIIFTTRGQDAKAYMSMETNPGVQVVLDTNNKVVGEVALNTDGEQMLAVVSFKGMTAEDAAKLFAQTATEMDKMNGNQDGTTETGKAKTVNIQISAEKTADYENLAKSVKDTVNKYFSDNGVFAGAVTNVSNNVKSAAEKMVVDTTELAHMTTQEILNYTKESSSELEQMSLDTLATVKTTYTELYNSMLAITDKALTTADEILADAETAWKKMEKEYNEASETVKQGLQPVYNELKDAYDKAVQAYNDAKAEFNTKKAEFKKQLDAKIDEIVKSAENAFNELKATAKTTYENTKKEVNKSIDAFKKLTAEQKTEMQNNIKAFQDDLATAV